jgi:hypothetical protein
MSTKARFFALLALLFSLILTPLAPASAGTFNPGCSVANLATNVTAAGGNNQDDTINLASGCTYNLSSTLTVNADSGYLLTINGNGAVLSGGNLIRVLTINSGANVILNNVTIQDGYSVYDGGGIYNDRGTVTLTNSTVSDNSARYGGGISNSWGTLTLTNTSVSNNSALYNGGGLDNLVGSVTLTNTTVSDNMAPISGGGINSSLGTLTLTSSTISNNSSSDNGGGIYNNSTMALTNSTISTNGATGKGGGIYNEVSGTLTISGSTVNGNGAKDGGGIYVAVGSSLVATSSVFNANQSFSSGNGGGGIYNNQGSVSIIASTFQNNTGIAGGGIVANAGTTTVTNSTFSGNSATNAGGGIATYNSTMIVANSTFSGNSSSQIGGGGAIYTFGPVTLNNSILANSTAGGDCGVITGTVSATNTLIEDNTCGITNGVNGNKTGDPNLGALTGSPAYFPLNAGSIAINAGSNALIPAGVTTDQPGNPRIQGGTVDMGSFESAPPPTNTPTRTPTNTPTRTPTRTNTPTVVSGSPTTTPPSPNVNLVTNGTFDSSLGATYRWTFYDATQNVTAEQLNVAPTAPGGGFYQQINYGSGGEIFEVNFRARNSSLTQKTLNIIVRDTDYNPSYNCVFGMTANTPFQYYRMRFDTSEGFFPMMLQFALTGDSTLGLVIDDITMVRKTGISVPTTECTVSPPANTELVFNGAFDAGTGSWAAFNATMNSMNIGTPNGNIMQIGRNSGTTFGGFYQYSPYSAPANAVFQFSFQIGNQSAQARVINMLVRSEDWLDMHSCFITVPANTPLTTQTILLRTTKAWSNIVMQGWIQVGDYVSGPPPFRFDNISLQYLPASGYSGSTQCPAPLPMPQRVTDTPTPTITPSLMPSLTATASPTPTLTASSTEAALPSATVTWTPEPPTDFPTLEPPTLTSEPPTATLIPTDTATDVPTVEPPTAEPPTNTSEPPPEVTQSP